MRAVYVKRKPACTTVLFCHRHRMHQQSSRQLHVGLLATTANSGPPAMTIWQSPVVSNSWANDSGF